MKRCAALMPRPPQLKRCKRPATFELHHKLLGHTGGYCTQHALRLPPLVGKLKRM